MMVRCCLLIQFLVLLLLVRVETFHASVNVEDGVLKDQSGDEQSCSWEDRDTCSGNYRDPNLVPMTVDFGDRQDTAAVYIRPDVATFYNQTPGTVRKIETSFRGQFGKFINLSNKRLQVHWVSQTGNRQYIADLTPFGAAGTATFPNHKFVLIDRNQPDKEIRQWTIKEFNSLYVYDPYGSTEKAKAELTSGEFSLYKLHHDNLAFDKVYRYKTGRQWLSLYGRKQMPKFPMWPADAFGQTHQVVTKETHFIAHPPDELAKRSMGVRPTSQDHEIHEQLREYRSPEPTLTMNMTVISVSPRAFEIKNFLSQEEVVHILELATGIQLSQSTTQAGDSAKVTTDSVTRTSENSWISRQRTPIIDSIYRRAADLLQINEACFRSRTPEEFDMVTNSTNSISERLQLVHYAVGQRYTAHHDFSVPDLKHGQPSRFATLLLYLNEGMEGGETAFPRWLNGETPEPLKVKPEVGKAVLFYNVLPDGNYDERSQHAALPVIKGEKWLTNLWVWDPYMI